MAVPAAGDWIEIEWPCQSESPKLVDDLFAEGYAAERAVDDLVGLPEAAPTWLWFKALVVALKGRKFLLRFEDGQETTNSLKKLRWRFLQNGETETCSSELFDVR